MFVVMHVDGDPSSGSVCVPYFWIPRTPVLKQTDGIHLASRRAALETAREPFSFHKLCLTDSSFYFLQFSFN